MKLITRDYLPESLTKGDIKILSKLGGEIEALPDNVALQIMLDTLKAELNAAEICRNKASELADTIYEYCHTHLSKTDDVIIANIAHESCSKITGKIGDVPSFSHVTQLFIAENNDIAKESEYYEWFANHFFRNSSEKLSAPVMAMEFKNNMVENLYEHIESIRASTPPVEKPRVLRRENIYALLSCIVVVTIGVRLIVNFEKAFALVLGFLLGLLIVLFIGKITTRKYKPLGEVTIYRGATPSMIKLIHGSPQPNAQKMYLARHRGAAFVNSLLQVNSGFTAHGDLITSIEPTLKDLGIDSKGVTDNIGNFNNYLDFKKMGEFYDKVTDLVKTATIDKIFDRLSEKQGSSNVAKDHTPFDSEYEGEETDDQGIGEIKPSTLKLINELKAKSPEGAEFMKTTLLREYVK